jgi:hypothetical protein
MTFLGSRFFEKGSRSGSCVDVHLSMATAAFKPPAKDPKFSKPILNRRVGTVSKSGCEGAAGKSEGCCEREGFQMAAATLREVC